MTTAGLWIHVIAHALIATAYGAMLISLRYFLAPRRDVPLRCGAGATFHVTLHPSRKAAA